MESTEAYKKHHMSREEVAFLVDIIKEKKNIHARETDSVHNKMKEEAWDEVTDAYNAQYGSIPKTRHQLKMKWDNLKKRARKRLQLIELNAKAGGHPMNIQADDIIDTVAELMDPTDSGLELPYDGDGVLTKTQRPNKMQHLYGTPIQKKSFKIVRRNKESDGRLQKNLAIAKYFEKKTEKLELEIKLLKMEVENVGKAVKDPMKE